MSGPRFSLLFLLTALSTIGFCAEAHEKMTAVVDTSVRHDIVLYVLPDCGYCEKARQLLAAHGLQWREVDIGRSVDGKEAFTRLGGVGTPLLTMGKESVQGFDTARIEALLARNGAIVR
jgi:glutaredoxin